MEKYDGRSSGFEIEIRGFIDEPEGILQRSEEKGTYDLEDTFYFPNHLDNAASLEESEEWHPHNQTLRFRKFSPVGYMAVFSIQHYEGAVKFAKKFVLAKGKPDDIKQMLAAMGYVPLFTIKRKGGIFLSLRANPEKTLVVEEIEKLGWMFEAHAEADEKDEMLVQLGIDADEPCLLEDSLPSYYYKKYIKK
jgi:adenylate cyclase class IV